MIKTLIVSTLRQAEYLNRLFISLLSNPDQFFLLVIAISGIACIGLIISMLIVK